MAERPETNYTMKDPQEDSMNVGNQHFGPTGANNDIPPSQSGETLEGMLSGAKKEFAQSQPGAATGQISQTFPGLSS